MSEEIYQIYDRIFKRIFSLSTLAIINLINGLFGTNYQPDSTVEFSNIEFVSAALEKRLADIIIIVENIPYHLEAQMYEDGSIVLRAFEYGFYTAMRLSTDSSVLRFPEPVIIYLDTEVNVPETSSLTLDFGKQGAFTYQVRNFIYQEHELDELNRKKMISLVPFQLLKLRKIIRKNPSEENFALLQNLILDDILSSIKANLTVGNINVDDAEQLRELTLQLYDHIYANYATLGGYANMKPLLDGAIELPLDKYRIRIDELEEKTATLEAKAATFEEKATTFEERAATLEEENRYLMEELEKYKNETNK